MNTLVATVTVAAALLAGPTDLQLSLPPPTGPHPVGTVSLHLVDRSRADPWVPAERFRELMVQVWYPARTVRGYPRADWVTPGVAARLNPPGSGYVLPVTHGHTGAPAAPGRRPVVLHSPGFGMERTSSTALVEDLASHGYAVVTIDHPHDAQFVEFPSGRIATQAVGPGDLPKALDVRVADIRFVLDQLPRIGRGLHLDLSRVGMAGHSLGGAATAETMAVDRRVRAGVNLDGSFSGPARLDRPFLMLGAVPAGEPDDSWARMWAGLRGPRYWLEIEKAGHLSFTDLQVLLPQAGTPGEVSAPVISSIDGERSVAVQRAHLRAFFDRHLRHRDGRLLDGPSARYPEIRFRP